MNRMVTRLIAIAFTLTMLLMTSCEKEIHPPAISKPVISSITVKGAIAQSKLIWDGGANITECGFCWNTTGMPTLEDSYVRADKTAEEFSSLLDVLEEGTRYYIRSYAKNSKALNYSLQTTFTTVAFRKPVLNSPYISFVGHSSVICSGGRIISDNTSNILSKGICWSTSPEPTIDDQIIELGGGTGAIGSTIEGLEPGTVYYFRAYATNVVGLTYGGNLAARTFDGYTTDYEGHIYSTVRLGNQEWMNRNLETCYYSNGERISTTGTQTINIELENNPSYQWAFLGHEDHEELLDDYGRLYTWYTATDNRNICPAGWHLPTIEEWNELIIHLGGEDLTCAEFRRCYNYSWNSHLNPGKDEGSFHAQLAGFREPSGRYQYGSYYGTYWWSSTEKEVGGANTIFCRPSDMDPVSIYSKDKKYGYSVRCIKD
jgi:uncharacterized protein (TIGR02145 family)